MKTTLEERIRAAAEKARVLGNNAVKQPVSSILSLCVLGICAATLITFSQTNDTPPKVEVAATAQTMPVSRTLTSADGRKLDVTVLSKSETAIKAKRADGKEFEIKLDMLSPEDKTFIASLVNKKTSILFLVNINIWNYNRYSETLAWLRSHDYEVTIGVMDRTEMKRLSPGIIPPAEIEKAVVMPSMQVMDQYDILWIPLFVESPIFYEVTTHRAAKNGRIVIRKHGDFADKDNFLSMEAYWKTFMKSKKLGTKPYNYVISDKNWIYYEDAVEPASLEKTRSQLLRAVEALSK